MKKVKALLKEHGYKTTGKSREIRVRQEDDFLRVSLQGPAFTLKDDGDPRGGPVKIPTGNPSRQEIIDLLESSGLEKTQTVQVDFEIGKDEYSAYWKRAQE